MTTLYVAIPAALLVLDDRGGSWTGRARLLGTDPHCVAVDPLRPGRVWCGTTAGLWRSDDAGETWLAMEGLPPMTDISAVSASPIEPGVVYAGADPTALYRTGDGGDTWEELAALLALPSAPTWSFPPRPETSHVRWITPDPHVAGTACVCVEAGALVRTRDGGRTWADRVEDGPYDTHTLHAHPAAPGRLYSAAGDGFMSAGRGYSESRDGGDTWERPDAGLEHHYLWGAAVDAADPDTMLVSAASSPMGAHNPEAAESYVYRRSGGGSWRRVEDGLPAGRGINATVLAAHPTEGDRFYAASNQGVFASADGGERWMRLEVAWPAEYGRWRPNGVAVAV